MPRFSKSIGKESEDHHLILAKTGGLSKLCQLSDRLDWASASPTKRAKTRVLLFHIRYDSL